MVEYEVIILERNAEEASQTLNQLATMGWRVISTYAGECALYYAVLERESPVLTSGRNPKPVRAINEPRGVA